MPQVLKQADIARLTGSGRATPVDLPAKSPEDPLAAALRELARAIGNNHAAQHKALADAMRANADVADAIYELIERKERWRAVVTKRDGDKNIKELIFEQLP